MKKMVIIKNTQFTSNISFDDITKRYFQRKVRKTPYKLQKFGLLMTYEDEVNQQWHMLMPDCVREAFASRYQPYLEIAEKGAKLPSKKQIRMMTARRLLTCRAICP